MRRSCVGAGRLRQLLRERHHGFEFAVRLGSPMPGLGTAKQREANIASDYQLTAMCFQVHFAAVHGSGIRIENIAAAVFRTAGLDVSNDDHADYGLILSVVGAGATDAVAVAATENL